MLCGGLCQDLSPICIPGGRDWAAVNPQQSQAVEWPDGLARSAGWAWGCSPRQEAPSHRVAGALDWASCFPTEPGMLSFLGPHLGPQGPILAHLRVLTPAGPQVEEGQWTCSCCVRPSSSGPGALCTHVSRVPLGQVAAT